MAAPIIVKSDGERVPFQPEKIRETLRRAGAKPETVEHVLEKVRAKVKDGMATKKLLGLVRKELRREDRCTAHRYNLRRGLLKLGPAGFKFEQYVASILLAYGYDATVPQKEIAGMCVEHEIDVTAWKDGKGVLIEAKFRNAFDDTVTLKDAMATWARYMDINDAAKAGKGKRYDQLWIVTNARFSDRARQYCDCKHIRMVGWNSDGQSLAAMVDHQALYPITVLDDLRQWELDAFAKRGYMLCREIATKDASAISKQTGIETGRAGKIIHDCKELVEAK